LVSISVFNCAVMRCVSRHDKSWLYDAHEHAQACKQHMAFNVPEVQLKQKC